MTFTAREQKWINRFRGIPDPDGERGNAFPYRMDSLVEVVCERHHLGEFRPEDSIMSHWKEVMGADNARRCSPQLIDPKQRLIVRVSNPILRRELDFHRATILDRVRKLPGCQRINAVLFRAG